MSKILIQKNLSPDFILRVVLAENLNIHSHIEPEIFSCIHVFNQWPLIIALLWRFQNEFALKTWVNWQKIRFFWSSMNESQQLNVSMVLIRWSVAKNLRKIHSFFIWHELTDLKQSVSAFFHCQLCDKKFRGNFFYLFLMKH